MLDCDKQKREEIKNSEHKASAWGWAAAILGVAAFLAFLANC